MADLGTIDEVGEQKITGNKQSPLDGGGKKSKRRIITIGDKTGIYVQSQNRTILITGAPSKLKARAKVVITGFELSVYNEVQLIINGKAWLPIQLHLAIRRDDPVTFYVPDFNLKNVVADGSPVWVQLSSEFDDANATISPYLVYSTQEEDEDEAEEEESKKVKESAEADKLKKNEETFGAAGDPTGIMMSATDTAMGEIVGAFLSRKIQNRNKLKNALKGNDKKAIETGIKQAKGLGDIKGLKEARKLTQNTEYLKMLDDAEASYDKKFQPKEATEVNIKASREQDFNDDYEVESEVETSGQGGNTVLSEKNISQSGGDEISSVNTAQIDSNISVTEAVSSGQGGKVARSASITGQAENISGGGGVSGGEVNASGSISLAGSASGVVAQNNATVSDGGEGSEIINATGKAPIPENIQGKEASSGVVKIDTSSKSEPGGKTVSGSRVVPSQENSSLEQPKPKPKNQSEAVSKEGKVDSSQKPQAAKQSASALSSKNSSKSEELNTQKQNTPGKGLVDGVEPKAVSEEGKEPNKQSRTNGSPLQGAAEKQKNNPEEGQLPPPSAGVTKMLGNLNNKNKDLVSAQNPSKQGLSNKKKKSSPNIEGVAPGVPGRNDLNESGKSGDRKEVPGDNNATSQPGLSPSNGGGQGSELSQDGSGDNKKQAPSNLGQSLANRGDSEKPADTEPSYNENLDPEQGLSNTDPQQHQKSQQSVSKATEEAVTLVNTFINGFLLDAALWVWVFAVPTFGATVLLGALVGDFLFLAKDALISFAVKRVNLPLLKGDLLKNELENIKGKIKFSTTVKVNVFLMNLVVLITVFIILIIVIVTVKGLCDGWVVGVSLKLSGYDGLCQAIDSFTTNAPK